MDGRSVYLSRKRLGEEMARLETLAIDADTIVVPVPDTSKAAADAMAYKLKVPVARRADPQSLHGPHVHRRGRQPQGKGRDEIHAAPRSARRQAGAAGRGFDRPLDHDEGAASSGFANWAGPREIHVRVACPPIIAPCFYGIDMSTIDELFAPKFLHGGELTDEDPSRNGGQARRRFAPLSAGRIDLPGRSASTAINSAKPASPANTQPPAGRNSIKSPCATRVRKRLGERTSCERRANFSRPLNPSPVCSTRSALAGGATRERVGLGFRVGTGLRERARLRLGSVNAVFC